MALSEAALGAIISGSAGVASAGISAGAGMTANRRAYRWTKKMYDYQNFVNQTQYSPAVVMERYRQAGINPNLAVGKAGGAEGPVGSMTANYQNPVDGVGDSLTNAVQASINAFTQRRQLDNQTAANEALVALQKAQAEKVNNESAKIAYYNANIQPWEAVSSRYGSEIKNHQVGIAKLTQQRLLNDISMFSLQKQKYQLGIDLMELERQYAAEYYQYRNSSVYWDSQNKRLNNSMLSRDLANYQEYGLRPQDPFYLRIGANVADAIRNRGSKSIWRSVWNSFFKTPKK